MSLSGLLLRGFGALTINAPVAVVRVGGRNLTALSKEVAERLTTDFKDRFTCHHNSMVNYPLAKMSELRVDCWPQGLQIEKRNAAAKDRTVTIAIAIQQRAADQEKFDILTTISEDVLDWLLDPDRGRWGSGKFLVQDGGFSGADVFDKLSKYEDNVFQSNYAHQF